MAEPLWPRNAVQRCPNDVFHSLAPKAWLEGGERVAQATPLWLWFLSHLAHCVLIRQSH
jgi:hypothetical protein